MARKKIAIGRGFGKLLRSSTVKQSRAIHREHAKERLAKAGMTEKSYRAINARLAKKGLGPARKGYSAKAIKATAKLRPVVEGKATAVKLPKNARVDFPTKRGKAIVPKLKGDKPARFDKRSGRIMRGKRFVMGAHSMDEVRDLSRHRAASFHLKLQGHGESGLPFSSYGELHKFVFRYKTLAKYGDYVAQWIEVEPHDEDYFDEDHDEEGDEE